MSSLDEKDEKKAADISAALPVAKSNQQDNAAVEVDSRSPDSLLVTWNGDADPHHPLNWPRPRKWAITILLSNGGLVTLMSGAMLAPSLHAISQDLGTAEAEAQIFLSIFVLAFAFGPMVLSPLAEVFGRRPVWILSREANIVTRMGLKRRTVLILCPWSTMDEFR